MTKKVAVALSGGVDSAVTAVLLKEQGYEVVGLTGLMTCSEESEQVASNARRVAEKLGIEHYTLDVSKEFDEKIINYFNNSYKNGLTPNPCIMCNKYIKWGVLFDYALNTLKADYIATGHYAKILEENGVYKLYPANDEHKDQLYFLFLLSQNCLAKTLFPLSEYKKSEVKELAEKYDLPPKSAKESQDICFIKAPMTTKKYLNNLFGSQKGDFVDIYTGKALGHHDGYWQYTIGQRKGIGIAAPEALFVIDINPSANTVYVGHKQALEVNNLYLKDFHWSYEKKTEEFEALVKIRYNMPAVKALIKPDEQGVSINFREFTNGITPGQACVLYDINDGHLLGGSWI